MDTLSDKRRVAGQMGGMTTARRHPGMHRQWGQLGGRRRLPTLAEIRAEEAHERRALVAGRTNRSLSSLKKEWGACQ